MGGGEGEAQGVWTLNWPTFLVTMARKWVRTNAGKGSVCMYVWVTLSYSRSDQSLVN